MTDDQIDDLLDQWEEEFENGRDIPIDELCKECPSLAPQIEVKIAQLRRLNGFLSDDRTLQPNHRGQQPADDVQVESRFVLNEFIDDGGLGSVYGGRDKMLKRDAAIKFLQKQHSQISDCVKQFKTECEITSRLDHPGIVPIYGHGMLPNGQPFYVMRRISGQTLRECTDKLHGQLTRAKLNSDQRLEFHSLLSTFVAVCQTIHYAHCRGVIHRDIKPANIMVGRHGETMVLDWGLAQTVARDAHHQVANEETLSLTLTRLTDNTGAGTPMYMSPEQHVGPGQVSILSDVYSLGATLFVLLTGASPFEASTLPDLKHKIIQGETTNPKTKYKWLSSALLSICKKAMAVHPEQRYVTALHLARDVERYLADEPVHAHPESLIRRGSRWMNRNRYLTFMLATALVVGLLGSSIYSSAVTRYARKENTALRQAKRARVQSLRLAAGFAANTVALKLSDRWRILEIGAQDERLIRLLKDVSDDPEQVDWSAFQSELMRFKESYHVAAGSPPSWFLCDAQGRQIARTPASDSIGKNYASRDYFHGHGNDPPPADAERKHITDVHRSKVYRSSTSGALKASLTRPIWSQTEVNPNRKFLGILGMSMTLGEFKELETGLGSSQLVMVVDTEGNVIGDEPGTLYEGLVLHHPELKDKQSKDASPANVSEALLSELRKIRQDARTEADENPNDTNQWTAEILPMFQDPLNPGRVKNTHWISAFAPIMIKGRPIDIADTGWGVIVAEREQDDPGIFGFRLKVLKEDKED